MIQKQIKILTWNIRSGGGKNITKIIENILSIAPDIVVLTEFRNSHLDKIAEAFRKNGLQWLETSEPKDRENGLLVASKIEILNSRIGHHEEDPQRWLSMYLPSLNTHLIAIHIPGAPDHKFIDGVGISGKTRKKFFWEKVLHFAIEHINEPVIFVGDFNTGLKIDAEGSPFLLSKYMKDLIALGYTDVWRKTNGETREFTWYSQRKVNGETVDFNGFRLDYMFVSPVLSNSISRAYHSHDERKQKISDHSLLICCIDIYENGQSDNQ